MLLTYEPQHEISNNMRSLIRAFATRLNMLLTEHNLEFLSLKGGCTVYTFQNAILLEIKSRLICNFTYIHSNIWGDATGTVGELDTA